MTGVYSTVIGLGLLVLLLGMLVVGLLRSHAEILRKLDSLGAGLDDDSIDGGHRLTLTRKEEAAGAPNIVGVNPDGESVAISPGVGRSPLLLAFLSTSCSSCTVFWEGLNRAEMTFGGRDHRVLITTLGPDEESPTRARSLLRGKADVVMSSEAWEAYGVPGAPYFVLTDPTDGIIGEGSAENFDALTTFLSDSSNDRQWDRDRVSGADRADRIDRELRAAGIEPGDPRLHHNHGDIEEGDDPSDAVNEGPGHAG